MEWWSRLSSAKLLFIVVADESFSAAESAYREAARHIEQGIYDAFSWAGLNIEIHPCSGERFAPSVGVPEWNGFVPDDLAAQWMTSGELPTLQAETRPLPTIGAGRAKAAGSFPAQNGVSPGAGLSSPWATLFPGGAIVEGVLLRSQLRHADELMSESRVEARRTTGAFLLERTEVVACPGSPASWALGGAEDPNDPQIEGLPESGTVSQPCNEINNSAAFQERAPQKHDWALVAFGWAGVMWLQFDLLAGVGRCSREGCWRPAALPGRAYCETHWPEARRERARVSQQQFRARHRHG